ncbi:MAG: ABC transporter permease [Sandaracinaceae bacterium]|nr:ABC transporter permease [Sandaracinaceae bacterium]
MDRLKRLVAGWIEDPNPILLKELRATFRTALFARFLYISTGLVSLLVLSVGAVSASGDVPPATVGQILFQLFLGVTLFVICLVAPGYAATTITSEREQRTWESLQLSGMSASRIVHGKFIAAYASIALVIVSLAPVSGIGFLFGGVAPTQVGVGLLSMLVALAPAIAFGVALSARLPSTRIAIVLATFVYVPLAFMGTSMMGIFGSIAHDQWHLPMEGPFFYTDAFTVRADEWDTWVLLLGGTAYAIGLPVWFLLASAVAGVRPAAENRSAPLKSWSIWMTLATLVVALVSVALAGSARDQAKLGLVGLTGIGTLLGFYALLFANEPPLAPRPYELALREAPVWRRLLSFFGPGAAGTLRFSAALIVGTAVTSFLVVVGVRHVTHPSWHDHIPWDLASFVLIAGLAVVALFGAAFGTWMRLVLRHGLAARVITISVVAAAAIAPFMFALVIDPHSVDRLGDEAPLLVHFSSVYPVILAAQLNDLGELDAFANLFRLAVPGVTYGLLALACWATVEARVRGTRKLVERRRAQFAASDATAVAVAAVAAEVGSAAAAESAAASEPASAAASGADAPVSAEDE